MDRRSFAAVQFAKCLKNTVQLVFQTCFFCDCRKVVRTDSAAIFIAEGFDQQFGKRLKHFIAFFKTMPYIEEFHAAEIYIQQDWFYAILLDCIFTGFCQFEKIGHIRKTRQIIIRIRFDYALIPKLLIQCFVQFISGQCRILCISSFIGIPYLSQSGSVIGINMLT